MPPAPLPDALTTGAFTFREALAAGESDGGLRRRGLARVTHGVHSGGPLSTPEDQLAALLRGLPAGVALSHRSAAQRHGLPLTPRQQSRGVVDIMGRTGVGPIRRPEVLGHRGLEWRDVVRRDGLPVTSAPDTWVDFGELVRRDHLTLEDLVVVGDAASNVVLRPEHTAYDFSDRRPEWWTETTLEERLAAREVARVRAVATLRSRLEARVRPRGKVLLTQALPLIRPGVRSPMESRARLVFHDAGFPEPVVNLDIYDDDGEWLGEGDLVWPEQRVVAEYQGAHHADRLQASKDSDKKSRLRDRGWRTREIWLEDLADPLRRRAMLVRFARLLGHPVD